MAAETAGAPLASRARRRFARWRGGRRGQPLASRPRGAVSREAGAGRGPQAWTRGHVDKKSFGRLRDRGRCTRDPDASGPRFRRFVSGGSSAVEFLPSKQGVTGSNPVPRSTRNSNVQVVSQERAWTPPVNQLVNQLAAEIGLSAPLEGPTRVRPERGRTAHSGAVLRFLLAGTAPYSTERRCTRLRDRALRCGCAPHRATYRWGGRVVVSTQRSACFAATDPVVPPGASACSDCWPPRRWVVPGYSLLRSSFA